MSFIVAVLGAESTGKTTLVAALAAALCAEGRDAIDIDETLRGFCAREGRTPRRDEQGLIAAEQTRRIEAAAARHAIVVADTSALQTAVYSEIVFGDRSLYAAAEAWQRERVGLTLLTALDLPWQADGHQRDGEHVRVPVDALLRAALARAGVAFSIVSGSGPARLGNALAAVRHALGEPTDASRHDASAPRWQSVCERCGNPDCERRLFASCKALDAGSSPA
jgi:nicotinamide riboside kinase